jgi:transposase
VRKLTGMQPSAVVLFQDEIILRLFPVLRRAWSLKGKPATVGISGANARCVLFGTINMRTGHRILMRDAHIGQRGFQAFLRLLHNCYPRRTIWLILDRASAHTAPKSGALAKALGIELVWLPKQCPELNAMDHLWKEVKSDISANYQYANMDEHACFAENYLLNLTNKKALKRAGILSKNFWLKNLL